MKCKHRKFVPAITGICKDCRITELVEFAIWMTGCGYDFCQHKYFCEQRDKLLKTETMSDKLLTPEQLAEIIKYATKALTAYTTIGVAIPNDLERIEQLLDHITALKAERLELQKGINYAYENRFQVGMDGGSWYATEYDFINLQESESGWGDTPHDAVIELYELLSKEQES